MTNSNASLPRIPTPADIAAKTETRVFRCLACGVVGPHVKGRATYGSTGELLVQWWACTACEEGEAIE